MRNKKLKREKSSHIPEIILIFFVILTIAPIIHNDCYISERPK